MKRHRSPFRWVAFALVLFAGCVNTQTLPSLNFAVRVLDLESGLPVSGAQVIARLDSGLPQIPALELGPLITDQRGIVQVVSAERKMQIRGFDHNWVGGYSTWPWIHVVHPDYESSGFSPPSDTQREVAEKGGIVFKLQRKKSRPSP